jgi:hypothetical protein
LGSKHSSNSPGAFWAPRLDHPKENVSEGAPIS